MYFEIDKYKFYISIVFFSPNFNPELDHCGMHNCTKKTIFYKRMKNLDKLEKVHCWGENFNAIFKTKCAY